MKLALKGGGKRFTSVHQSITFSRRMLLAGSAQVAVGALLVGRLGWLSVAENERYRQAFEEVLAICRERNVAVQIIKSIARGPWAAADRTHSTWYQPLEAQADIDRAVHWVMGVLPDGKLLLIRNHRYSVGQKLIELPAGTLEKGEDPMNCAGRELLEETGYLAGRLTRMASFYASPGILTEKMHLFAAYDLTHQGQALEAGEEIEVLPTTLADAIEMIRAGQIEDSKTIAGVLMYERFQAMR